MKKKLLILTTIFCVSFNLFCAKINIAINPGIMWEKRAPQLAIWLEDENQNYIETLFVTKGASKKAWKFSPKEGRPDSLPVWYKSSKVNPAKQSDEVFDAVTSATPKNGIVVNSNLELQNKKTYTIKVEVNQSFDYNEKYTKKNSGVDGQPSVIYKGSFEYNNSKNEMELFLTQISKNNDDLENLTTAKLIIKSIFVVIE